MAWACTGIVRTISFLRLRMFSGVKQFIMPCIKAQQCFNNALTFSFLGLEVAVCSIIAGANSCVLGVQYAVHSCRRGWEVHSWQCHTVLAKGGVKYVVYIVCEFCRAPAQILHQLCLFIGDKQQVRDAYTSNTSILICGSCAQIGCLFLLPLQLTLHWNKWPAHTSFLQWEVIKIWI